METRTLGFKPSGLYPHPRLSYRLNRGTHPALPSSVELRELDAPMRNQASLGACTGFGWAAAIRFRDKNFLNITDPSVSELFIYYNERAREGSTASDPGAAVLDGAWVVANLGAPPEEDWPYDVIQYAARPPDAAYADAFLNRAPQPLAINNADTDEVKSCLLERQLIVFGFEVRQSFYDVGPDGIYRPSGLVIGGHCCVLVGYYPGWFVCRNSWGLDWGADGYFFMPTQLFGSYIVQDLWAIPNAA